MKFDRNFESSSLNVMSRPQQKFARVTTVLLSWRVQNFIEIGPICYEQEHYNILLNFPRNISGRAPDQQSMHYNSILDLHAKLIEAEWCIYASVI